jgi:mono/diheme cytochrome c family protein
MCNVKLSTIRLALAAAVTLTTVALHAQQTPPPPRVLSGPGPGEKHVLDRAGADRGRTVWAAECIQCHGTQARGTERGPNLTRSMVLLRDRNASELGPFLKKGHTMQSGRPSTTLTDEQIDDVSHFLHQRLNEILAKGIGFFKSEQVLTGDAAAGSAYFNGGGKCATCHGATASNLAGIGARYSPVDLQQRFLFPPRGGRGGRPNPATAVTVTVTPATRAAISGTLVQMDDFDVTLRDASGATRTIHRTPGMTVVKTDPLRAHQLLLDTITDKQMHDVVAYLATLN